MKSCLDFVLLGYSIRHDREQGNGGGCATFIKQGIPYRILGKGRDQEYIAVGIWGRGQEIFIINYYNPCKKLILEKLKEVHGQDNHRVIWYGDLNAHNTLWGGRYINANGQVVEELIEERELVCLNDGKGTRIDFHTGIVCVGFDISLK